MKQQRPSSSEPIVAEVVAKPAPRRRKAQFTIFGLMVLMFVASAGFAPLYYAYRGSQWDAHQQAKKSVEAQIEIAKKSAHERELNELTEQLDELKAKDKYMIDASSSRAVAVLMAVALPMLLMTIMSIAYTTSRYFRQRKRTGRRAFS